MEKRFAQQGDVVLTLVTEIPKTAKRLDFKGSFIVEKGEGVNTHEITNTEGLEVYEDKGTLFLKTGKETKLVHNEHGSQVLEPNKIYRKDPEMEFDYEADESRRTRD